MNFVLYPFVKCASLKILKDSYIGSCSELNTIINDINNIDFNSTNSIRLTIRILVKELDVKLFEDRKLWLLSDGIN